ncbi:MAG: hypothetical protein Kow00120_01660 [Anaerolineae bacterium]
MQFMSGRNATRRRRVYGFGLIALLLALVQACTNAAPAGIEVGATAPDFTLPSATGGEVSLADYAGRQPVLLYFHMAVG